MKQRLQKVRIEDFNIAALRRAAREGRLYIVPAVECEINIEQEVLAYVSRIAEYAAPPYRESIDEMWRHIVSDSSLSPLLRNRRGEINKYSVTAIALFLFYKGCYDFPTATAVHLQLEGVAKRNKYYTNGSNYNLKKAERNALCSIINEAKMQAM